MKKLFATRKARVALAAITTLAVAGVAVPRIAVASSHNFVEVNASDPANNVSKAETSSPTVPVDVTFTLSGDNASTVTVGYRTLNGNKGNNAVPAAEAGKDYAAQSGTIEFPPHTSTRTVTFNIFGDSSDEDNEVFSVELTTLSAGWEKATPDYGTVTILDDDSAPNVFLDDRTMAEGNAGQTAMNFRLRFSAPSGRETRVHVKTQAVRQDDNPLTAPLPDAQPAPDPANPDLPGNPDFDPVDTDVVIAANTSFVDIPVMVYGDITQEPDEYFELQLSEPTQGPSNLQPLTDYGTGIISNEDATPSVSISDAANAEGAGTGTCNSTNQSTCNKLTFTVTLTPASAKTVRVAWETEDRSAVGSGASQDYFPASGTDETVTDNRLLFNPGETSKQITVTIRGDNVAEPDERMAVVLSDPTNAVIGDAEASGVITNDDGGEFPTVVVGNAPDATEGTSTNSTFTITATWPEPDPPALPNTTTVVVFYKTLDGPEAGGCGTAVAGQDYTATTGSVEIPWSPTFSNTATVNVPILNNNQSEADECFQLQITDANAQIDDATGQAKIKDTDAGPKISIADRTVAEGNGGGPIDVAITVSLDIASGQTVSVGYRTPQPNSGTAQAGEDYTNVQGTLVFEPGQTTRTFNIPVERDAKDEVDETINAIIENPTGGATLDDAKKSAALTLTNDDTAPTVSIGDVSVDEGSTENSTAPFVATLSAPSGKQVTVVATTGNGTATQGSDYTARTATLTFAPGATQAQFAVGVIADTLDEANETFTATLSGPTNATLGSPSTGTATIEDDDVSAFSIGDATVTEGNSGTTNATFTVGLSPASAQQLTVNYATADGTATQPGDYTQTTGTLTFAPGETSKTINVPVTGDTAVEPDEGFTVTLSNSPNATLADAIGNGTITNDDTTGTTTSTSTTTTTTTLPGNVTPKITTGPGPGGGPHIREFNPNGTPTAVDFFDGSDTTGKRVARGDLNGDGRDEIITGTGVNSAGVVSVYSPTEQLVASTFPYNNGNWFGGIFVAAGDVDGDGKAELITSVGAGGGPHVKIWKLVNNTLVEVGGFMAYANWHGGATIAAGNLDNDAAWEIVTGVGAGGGPHVKAFDVTVANNVMSFAEKFGFYAYTNAAGQPNWNGGVNVAVGDVDGDGFGEIGVAPWANGGPHVRLFNHDGTLQHGGVMVGNPTYTGGVTIAMGNVIGDSKAEVVVGSMTQSATVRVWNGDLTPAGESFTAYPNFNGGLWVAAGKS